MTKNSEPGVPGHTDDVSRCGHSIERRPCAAAEQYWCFCCDSCSELCAAKFKKA